MRTGRRRSLALAVGLLLALILGTAPSATAGGEPTTARPQSYRYHADIALSADGVDATGTGDGEFDLANNAFHIVAESRAEDVTIRLEFYLVDGKLYSFNPRRNRWEYITLDESDLKTLLPLPGPKVPVHPTATYETAGTATIGGATTQRWRASGDFNALIPSLTRNAFTGSLLEEVLTSESFIGAENRYLFRTVTTEQGIATRLGGATSSPQPISSRLVYEYSAFDQPITITPPPGAVPADENPTRPPLPSVLASVGAIPNVTLSDRPLAVAVAQRLLLPPGLPLP